MENSLQELCCLYHCLTIIELSMEQKLARFNNELKENLGKELCLQISSLK